MPPIETLTRLGFSRLSDVCVDTIILKRRPHSGLGCDGMPDACDAMKELGFDRITMTIQKDAAYTSRGCDDSVVGLTFQRDRHD